MSKGFTLIEVMISVVIISIVIAGLLEMRGNSTHLFMQFSKQSSMNQYASLLLSNEVYGFENKKMGLDRLVQDFNLDNDLRRELKNIKIELTYQELDKIDMRELEDEGAISSAIFEIGKTHIKTKDLSISALRLRLQ